MLSPVTTGQPSRRRNFVVLVNAELVPNPFQPPTARRDATEVRRLRALSIRLFLWRYRGWAEPVAADPTRSLATARKAGTVPNASDLGAESIDAVRALVAQAGDEGARRALEATTPRCRFVRPPTTPEPRRATGTTRARVLIPPPPTTTAKVAAARGRSRLSSQSPWSEMTTSAWMPMAMDHVRLIWSVRNRWRAQS